MKHKNYLLILILWAFSICTIKAELTEPAQVPYIANMNGLNASPFIAFNTEFRVVSDSEGYDYLFMNFMGKDDFTIGGLDVVNTQKESRNTLIVKITTPHAKVEWAEVIANLQIIDLIDMGNGNIQVLADAFDWEATGKIELGNQVVALPDGFGYGGIAATFNVNTKTWSNIQVVKEDAPSHHFFDKYGNYYLAGSIVYTETITINGQTAVSNPDGLMENLYVVKYSPDRQLQWSKVTHHFEGFSTSIYRPTFAVDKDGNAYMAAGIGHASGKLSLGGHIVQNDTIENSYDSSYTDIFLYKINADGSVAYGKTYLNSGNEIPENLYATADGNLYLTGDYNGKMTVAGNVFPPCGYRNHHAKNYFIAQIDSKTGTFNWGVPFNSNTNGGIFTDLDENDNIYFATSFFSSTLSLQGKDYHNRTISNPNIDNFLVGKITPNGSVVWASVMGAQTEFGGIIQNEAVNHFAVHDDFIIMGRNRLNYGSNKDTEWGPDATPDAFTYADNFVVDAHSGALLYGIDSNLKNSIYSSWNKKSKTIGLYSIWEVPGDHGFYIHYLKEVKPETDGIINVKLLKDNQAAETDVYWHRKETSPWLTSPVFTTLKATSAGNGNYTINLTPEDGKIPTPTGVFYPAGYCAGFFLIEALATENSLPTYFGDTHLWEESEYVLAPFDETPKNLTINLIALPVVDPIHTSKISGTIRKGSIASVPQAKITAASSTITNNSISGFTLYLESTANQQIVAKTQPNEKGEFTFEHVPIGNYKLSVNQMGVQLLSTYTINISQNNTHETDIDYLWTNNGLSATNSSGMHEPLSTDFKLYPNPVTDVLYIDGVQDGSLIQIYDSSGRKVMTTNLEHNYIPVSHLNNGLYFIVINNLRAKFVK